MLRIILILILLSTKTYADSLPELTHHSEPLITVSGGDILVLRAQLTGQSRVRWYSSTRLLCEGLVCKVDTSSWSIGRHRIVLVAVNQFGSRVVDYHLQLRQPKPDAQPKTYEIPLVTAVFSVDSVGKDQDYVISKSNTGFSYRSDTPHLAQKKLQIVRNFPRKLDWNENLRSSNGHLKFGRLGSDEHYLWPGGQLQLLHLQEQTRIIILQNGTLRSRSLAPPEKSPGISVLAADWLQIDGHSHADFVVELPQVDAKNATIHVLRGEIQVRWRDPLVSLDVFGELSDEERAAEQLLLARNSEQIYFIAAGQRLEIAKDQDGRREIGPLLAKATKKFLQETTPHLWNKDSGPRLLGAGEAGAFLEAARLTAADQGSPEQQLSVARSDVEQHDYLVAMERLSHAKSLESSFEWQFIAGMVYAGLSQPKRAVRHLRMANRLRPNDPELAFVMGNLLVSQGKWKRAQPWLLKALSGENQPTDLIYYYLGVAAYNREDWQLSRRYFSFVATDSRHIDLRQSSRKFLQLLVEKQDFLAEAHVFMVHDSHIFGIANESTLRAFDGSLSSSGLGYHGGATVQKRFAMQRSVDWAVKGKFSRRGWLAEALSEADRVDQLIGVDLRAGAEKQWNLGLALESILIGSQRALDGIGLVLSHRFSKRFARPTLSLGRSRYQDPLPAYGDLLDPLSEEWQAVPSDRSSVVTYLRLSFHSELERNWIYTIQSELWQRTLTEALAKTFNERRLDLQGQLKWEWLSGLDLVVALGLRQRQFLETMTDRQDFRMQSVAGIEWRFMDQWQWLSSAQYQYQRSSQGEFRFSRIMAQSGVAYQF